VKLYLYCKSIELGLFKMLSKLPVIASQVIVSEHCAVFLLKSTHPDAEYASFTRTLAVFVLHLNRVLVSVLSCLLP